MAFDPVPFFVGGGARHPAETARTLAYAATSGAGGVVASGDLAITQTPVAGTSVRAAVGGAVIPNLYPGGGQQSYAVRATTSTDVPVTATDSGSGRVDLVIARIDDPQYGGTIPADVTVGPYVRLDIIQNVAAGSTDIPAGLAYPAIALARLDIPASTATITTAMITPLAKVANPKMVPAVVGRTTATLGPFTGENTIATAPTVVGDGVKRFKVTLTTCPLRTVAATGTFEYRIKLDGVVIRTGIAAATPDYVAVGGGCSVTNVPVSGTHTYTATCIRIGGTSTATFNATVSDPIEIIVEQIA